MELTSDPKVTQIFSGYPKNVRDSMQHLRELILETANETAGVHKLEETLKWGEPSYITKNGSTLRIDWKENTPNQYAIYFQCNSRLVDTFRMVFDKKFQFEGKRAVIFQLNERIPEKELKQCIAMTLQYHTIKHLPFLGAHL